jgi:nicotinamidase-related amidase
MKPAIIIVDILEGNYGTERNADREEEKIVPVVRDFLKKCRGLSIPVIFACDSFMEKDFIFKGRMKPHAIRGTNGTKPLSDLEPEETDIILEKRQGFVILLSFEIRMTDHLLHLEVIILRLATF